MPELRSVVVAGAGTMGSQIALQTALSGRYRFRLVDAEPGQLEKAWRVERGELGRKTGRGFYDYPARG